MLNFQVSANILQPLIDVAEKVLLFFHDSVGFGWGLSIVALTLSVRIVLIPLTFKQFKSMQALQRLAPQMKAIQEKYKDDQARMRQEMMRFYQENKINPLGSCLPMILQMPFFFALFYMLQSDLRVDICNQSAKPCGEVAPGSADFLFIPDLTDKATGTVLVALILLYVGSQLASSLLMSTTADTTQKRLMIALPIVFVIFIINFPAGLIVYWITTNLWTVAQQYLVRRFVGPPVTPAAVTSKAGSPGPTGGPPPPPPRKRRKSKSGR